VDFGAVGYLTPQRKDHLGSLLFALVQQDADAVVRTIVRMGAAGRTADRRALQRDVHRLLLRYYDASLASVPIAEFLSEVMAIAFKHRIRLPSDLALLARTVIVLEGVARSLDPSFVLARHLRPFVLELVREPLSVRRALKDTLVALHELDALLKVLPRRADVISEQMEAGEFNLGVELRQLSEAMRKLDAIGNRLAFSVIVAAIVVGSALILAAGERAATFEIPFVNVSLPVAQIGFLVAGLLGAWLLFSIVRSRGL
jgi:ubiquinone biosynthesis protein